ncbi:hypothetical protein ACFZAS_41355, partial [Streptomyces lavendulae]
MDAVRTTPPRPLDVTAVFPRLAPLARTATRLHPRPGAPSVHDSSVGGAPGGAPPPPGAPRAPPPPGGAPPRGPPAPPPPPRARAAR